MCLLLLVGGATCFALGGSGCSSSASSGVVGDAGADGSGHGDQSASKDASSVFSSDGSKVDDAANSSGSGPTCGEGNDCPNWYCECQSGPPVNAAHCTNARCEDASEACPKACADFGTCWLGTAGGGWDGGTNAGETTCGNSSTVDAATSGCADGTSFTDLGKTCSGGTSCQSGLCFGVSPSFLCTKRCSTANDCPASWACVAAAGESFSICMEGSLSGSGAASTNLSCSQAQFSDVGAACNDPTDCQSWICIGSSYCSKRCDTDADCPSGDTCHTGPGFKYCIK